MNNEFSEIYRLYQSLLLKTFEEIVTEKGWKIVKRIYSSIYSKDITRLELRIYGNGTKEEGSVFLANSWKEILFIDRDETPLRFDSRILNREFGIAKTIRIVTEKAETMDAIFRGDMERVHALGKILGRIKGPVPVDPKDHSKGSVLIHYEAGVEQSDSGKVTTKDFTN